MEVANSFGNEEKEHISKMGKRLRPDEPSEDTSKPPKRPRANATPNYAPPEEITSARQLQNLLVFEQDQAQLLNCRKVAKILCEMS